MREMKDSGIEWIGEIPAEWNLKRLKAIFIERKEQNDPQKTDFILSLGAAYGVVPYSEKEGGGNKAKEDLTDYRLAYPNDIVMNSMNIISGSVGISKYFGCVSPVYYILYPRNSENCTDYFCYMFQTKAFQRSLLGLGNGILIKESSNGNFNTVRMRIPMEKLGIQLLPVPTVSEQRRIADFLDSECARIDAVIEQTRASIEEYKKLKQSVITEAVTNGIRGDRPMKDSGFEWIGNVASVFQCRKLKTFSDVISKGATPKEIMNAIDDTYNIRYIKSENIVDNHLVNQPEFGIKLEVHEGELKRSQLSVKDVLFVIAGASIGKTAIMKKNMIPANTNQATCFIRVKEEYMLSQKLLWYILQSDIVKTYISLFAVQSAQPNLSMADLGDMRIPFPCDECEEKEIISFLDQKIYGIDNLIHKKENLLEELETYKKSIIFEYVTGKKEVV